MAWRRLRRTLSSRLRGGLPASADLCCYWFEKARRRSRRGSAAGRPAGHQGIRGGANRMVLSSGSRRAATSSSPRVTALDPGRGYVHVSMVGFDGGQEERRELDGVDVPANHADLTSNVDTTLAVPLRAENANRCSRGSQQRGPFDIDERERESAASLHWRIQTVRPNSDVVVPSVNGAALTPTSRPSGGLSTLASTLRPTPQVSTRRHSKGSWRKSSH